MSMTLEPPTTLNPLTRRKGDGPAVSLLPRPGARNTTAPGTPPAEPGIQPTAGLTRNTVCLSISLVCPGFQKQLSTDEKEKLDPDDVRRERVKHQLRHSKKLIESSEFEAIQQRDRAARKWLQTRCNKSPLKGVYLLSLRLVKEVEDYLQAYEVERRQLIELFLVAYPGRVEEARSTLGEDDFFDEADYPTTEELRQAFRVKRRYLSFAVPSSLRGAMSAQFLQAEQAKAEAMWAETGAEIRDALRVTYAEFFGRLHQSLQTGPDGKVKRLNKTAVSNLTEFLDVFEHRNLTNDTELAQLVAYSKNVLSGIDTDILKNSDFIRDAVKGGLDQVEQQVAALITVQHRKFTFSDHADPHAD